MKSSPDTIAVKQTTKVGVTTKVVNWYMDNINYATITGLMTMESSIIPIPSEVIIPSAAFKASNKDSKLNIFLVIAFGTLGSVFGALINYFLALWLGRIVIYKIADSKLGKLCLLSSGKLEKAEKYFNERGNLSTFIGRLLPGIRQLISFPAGLAKMKLHSFILYTALGALVWNSILAAVGYIAHGQLDVIHKYSSELSIAALLVVFIFVLYILYKWNKKKNKKKAEKSLS